MKSVRPSWVTNNKVRQATNKVFDYGRRKWRNFAENHKRKDPLCAHCQMEGKTKLGQVTDHIIPINEGGNLWDMRNIQNLCRIHDNMKRSRESRGYVSPSYGDYGDLLPATSLDLYDFDIHWNSVNAQDIKYIYHKDKSTIILGPPASGKTSLSNKLYHELDIDIMHSDDHLAEPNNMVDQCKAIINKGKAYHVEGSQAHLMLMHGPKYMPDVILWVDCVDLPTLYRRYRETRDITKFDMALGSYYIRMYETLKYIENNGYHILKYRIMAL